VPPSLEDVFIDLVTRAAPPPSTRTETRT
jgi:hypothetical protein